MPKKSSKHARASSLITDAKALDDNQKSEIELSSLRAENAKWRRKHKMAVQEGTGLKAKLDAVLGVSDAAPTTQIFNKSASHKQKNGVAAIAVASDWHVEERVFPERVGGKNSFDLVEAETRIERFFCGIIEKIELHGHEFNINELWVPLLGDLMSGTIHEELLETNTLTPVEAVVFLRDMLCSGIDTLLKKTKIPITIPTVCGNHSRTTEKKRAKTAVQNSYEWLLYVTLAKHYLWNNRVQFIIGEGQYNTVEIKGRVIRLHHGDGFRYMGGVGGLSVPANRHIANQDLIKQADYDFFGHHHSFLLHYPKWVSCGCLVGYSEYAMSKGLPFQHPTQVFALMDREYGLRIARPIFLTEPARTT